MLSANNSPHTPSRNGKPKKRKLSRLEKKVKKEGKKSLRKVLQGKTKGHFKPTKGGEDDYEGRSTRKTLKNQQNISDKSTDPKQEAAVSAALENMKPKKKTFVATGSTRKTRWIFNKRKNRYKPVKDD